MRSVLHQPEVVHVYLGSRRHMMERIFNDEHEPFWRSAKRIELGVIAPEAFGDFVAAGFARTGRAIQAAALEGVLEVTRGHPYATQELCYFLWQETPDQGEATAEMLERALERVIASENAHFALIWQRASGVQRLLLQALAREPGRPLTAAYRARQPLPAPSTVQRAVEKLVRDELIGSRVGEAWIAEPFLREWVARADA